MDYGLRMPQCETRQGEISSLIAISAAALVIELEYYKFISFIQLFYQWVQATACDPGVRLLYGIIYSATIRKV